MRETIALVILGLALAGLAGLILHLRRKARHDRWLRQGHGDYSKLARRPRGLFR